MTNDWQDIRQQAQEDILAYMSLLKPGTKLGRQHYLFRDVIQDIRARKLRFICLSCPPRHSKSYTFSQALPAWWLGNSPTDQVIATSYAAALAQSFGSSVRADMSSGLYGQIFSPQSQPSGSSSSGSDFSTNSGGKYKAVGVGGSITGFGGDLIIVDDPTKNAETADSAAYKDMLEKFFGETLYTRLMPNGCIIVMMTRWREDDLIAYVLKNFGDLWTYINIPAIVEEQDLTEPTSALLGRNLGEALWPEFFNEQDLAVTRKILGESAFQALYQGRPSSKTSGPLPATMLQWASPGQFLDRPKTYSFWSWDVATSNAKTSCWNVGQHWTVYGTNEMFMSDYVRERGSFTDVVKMIQNADSDQPADFTVLEHCHMGIDLKDQLKIDSPEMQVYLHQPRGSKLERLQLCLPKWRDKEIWFERFDDRDDFQDCIDELVKAGLTTYTDFMDACTQAILFAKQFAPSAASASPAVSKATRPTGTTRLSGRSALIGKARRGRTIWR